MRAPSAPARLAKPRQADGLAGAVGARAGHDLDAAGRLLDHGGDDALVLLVVERGRFAGGADGRQAVGALLDVPVHQAAQALEIDVAAAKRGDQRHRHAGELFALGAHVVVSCVSRDRPVSY